MRHSLFSRGLLTENVHADPFGPNETEKVKEHVL